MKGSQDGCCPMGPWDESGFIDHPRTEPSTCWPAFLPDVAEATRCVLPELACHWSPLGRGRNKSVYPVVYRNDDGWRPDRDRRWVCVVSAGMERVMNAEAGVLQSPDELAPGGPLVATGAAGLPSWRVFAAATLALAAAAVWFTVACQEGRFARNAMGPDSDLLSAAELEDQLNI